MSENQDDDKTQSFTPLTKDTLVGHYRIIEKIGAGGMGDVYLAFDTKLNRKVALKFLPPHLCQDEDCRKRFTREAQAAAGLDHPNIAAIYEVGDFQGRPFYAMQVVEGQTLKDVIAGKDLSIEQILKIAIQVCEGLQAAHDKGIIHRDIKPSNILLDQHGRVRIVDFGLAAIRGSEHLTKTGSTLGTIGYMSPEQVRGEEIDHRSDLFSLGVVLYELITKQNPFKRDSEAATLKAVSDDLHEPLARYKRDVPELLESVMAKLLEKDPAHRYQGAAGVVSDLKRLKRDSDSPISASTAAKVPKSLLRIVLPIGLVVLAVAVLVLKPWKIEISPSQEAIAAENRLVIMYFDNLVDPEDSARLGEIAANLLITDLSESQYVQVVSSQRLFDIFNQLGKAGEKEVGPDIASEAAAKARAKWMLRGSILKTEPEIVLTSQLIEVSSGDVVATQRIEGETDQNIFALVDLLTIELKNDLELPADALEEPDRPIADITTSSPEAYRHYLLGMEYKYRFYPAEAEASFREALRHDSTLAMAYAWLLEYAPDDEFELLRSNMLKYAHKASRKEQMYISFFDAFCREEMREAVELFYELVRQFPEEKFALWQLALMERNIFRQREQSIRRLEELLTLDPMFGQAYNFLVFNYAELGDYSHAFQAADKYIEVAGDPNSYDTRGCLYAETGQLDEAMSSFQQALEVKPDFQYALANMGLMHLFKQEYAEAERRFQKLASHSHRDQRTVGRLNLARIPLYRGQFQEALRKLNVATQAHSMESGSLFTLLNTLYVSATIDVFFCEDHTAGLIDIQKAYDLIDSSKVPQPFHKARFKGLEALGRAKAGRFHLADSLLHYLSGMFDSSWVVAAEIYCFWRGLVDYERGDYSSSIQFLEQAEKTNLDFPERFFLARSYLAVNRVADAVKTLEAAMEDYRGRRYAWIGLSALVHYYAGLAYERSQWDDKAITQYKTFLNIWKNADPRIKEVEDAKLRLARLQGDS